MANLSASALVVLLSAVAEGEEIAAGPTLWGLEPYQIVSISMLILIGIMVWKKVPAMITGGLDARIDAIREQLDEAKNLRAEAEALRDEYSAKIAGAEKDAQLMLETAQKESDAILAKAEEDSKTMVARRKKMAEDKIAAAEREAVDALRRKAADAASQAAAGLIAQTSDAKADGKLADQFIAGL